MSVVFSINKTPNFKSKCEPNLTYKSRLMSKIGGFIKMYNFCKHYSNWVQILDLCTFI